MLVFAALLSAVAADRVCGVAPTNNCAGNYVTGPYSYERPYGASAYWNTPVCQLGRWSRSDEYVYRWWHYTTPVRPFDPQYYGALNIDFGAKTFPTDSGDFTRPEYDARNATTTRRIRINTSTGYGTNIGLTETIPWNPSWRPSSGSDGMMTIFDPTTSRELHIWFYNPDSFFQGVNCLLSAGGFDINYDICVGSAYWIESSGQLIDYRTFEGTTGHTGISNGMPPRLSMTAAEVAAGEIRHAIASGVWNPLPGPPCSDTDVQDPTKAGFTCGFNLMPSGQMEKGGNTAVDWCNVKLNSSELYLSVPQGMRLALNITDAYIESWLDSKGHTGAKRNTARIIARALKDYGWMLTDTNCWSNSLYTDGNQNPVARAMWQAAGIDPTVENYVGLQLMSGLIRYEDVYAVAPPHEPGVQKRWWKTVQNGAVNRTINADDCPTSLTATNSPSPLPTRTRTKTKRTHTRTKTKRTHTRTKTKRTRTRTKTKRTRTQTPQPGAPTRTKTRQTRTRSHTAGASHTPTPSPTVSHTSKTSNQGSGSGSSATVAGAVAGSIGGALLLGAGGFLLFKRKRGPSSAI